MLIFPVFHLMLTFPTGRLQSPRWRWVAGSKPTMLETFLILVGLSETLELFVATPRVDGAQPDRFPRPNFWDNQFGPVWGILLAWCSRWDASAPWCNDFARQVVSNDSR